MASRRNVRLRPRYIPADGVVKVQVVETRDVHPAVFKLKVMPAGSPPFYVGVCRPRDLTLPVGVPAGAVPGVMYRTNEVLIPVKDVDEATAVTGRVRAAVQSLCTMLDSRGPDRLWEGWVRDAEV